MKIIALFIAILMFAVGFDMCEDSNPYTEGNSFKKAQHENSEPENCSPFCHCAQCPFSVMLPENKAGFQSEKSSPVLFIDEFDTKVFGISKAIWQPPRAGLFK